MSVPPAPKHRASKPRATRRPSSRRLGRMLAGAAIGVTAVGVSAVAVASEMSGEPSAIHALVAPMSFNRPAASRDRDEVPVPPASGNGRRIVFDQSEQRVWLVEDDGSVRRTYLVSGSRMDNVEPGSYKVTSRARHARSYKGGGTFEYFARFTQGHNAAIGFHSVTRRRDGSLVLTRDQLGTAHTPGCVEEWLDDAKALWDFAPRGTKVVVTA